MHLDMPAPSIGVESYMHRAAKEVTARWLREMEQVDGGREWATLWPVSWRPNRPGPSFGVWLEYPFTWGPEGHEQVWDECGDRDGGRIWQDAPPTVAELIADGLRCSFVADIAIQHKGRISTTIEIVHKHPCTPEKLAFYRDRGIQCFQVPAQWVLSQVRRPERIVVL